VREAQHVAYLALPKGGPFKDLNAEKCEECNDPPTVVLYHAGIAESLAEALPDG